MVVNDEAKGFSRVLIFLNLVLRYMPQLKEPQKKEKLLKSIFKTSINS